MTQNRNLVILSIFEHSKFSSVPSLLPTEKPKILFYKLKANENTNTFFERYKNTLSNPTKDPTSLPTTVFT